MIGNFKVEVEQEQPEIQEMVVVQLVDRHFNHTEQITIPDMGYSLPELIIYKDAYYWYSRPVLGSSPAQYREVEYLHVYCQA